MAWAVVVVCAGCATRGQQEMPSHSPIVRQIRARLDSAVIPKVDLENVRVDQALIYWAAESRNYQPMHAKFQYVPTFPPPAKNSVATAGPATNDTQSAALDYLPKVTVHRRSITSKRLLDSICHQANLVWTITGAVIIITPSSTPAGELK